MMISNLVCGNHLFLLLLFKDIYAVQLVQIKEVLSTRDGGGYWLVFQ